MKYLNWNRRHPARRRRHCRRWLAILLLAAGTSARADETPDPMRANTIIRDPFPGDEILTATPVSMEMKGLDAETAFEKFAEATGMRIAAPRSPGLSRQPPPPITLKLEKEPLLEALMQFRAQASFTVTTAADGMRANYNPNRLLPGTWCVSGPFAFAITGITHSVTMDREGNIGASRLSGEGESLVVAVSCMAEPKLGVLQYPGKLTLQEVTDEKGHSLIPDPNGPKPAFARFQQPLATRPELSLALAYPKEEAGRRIKILKGSGEFLIRGQIQPLVIDNPLTTGPTEFTVAGMPVTVGKMTWNGETRKLEMHVTFQRGEAEAGLWASLPQALDGIPPKVETSDGRSTSDMSQRPALVPGDRINATYTFFAGIPPETAINVPAVKRITINIPVGSKQVTVPVEFRNLPLP